MESQNLVPGFFLSEEEKKALEKYLKILRVFFSPLAKLIKNLITIMNTSQNNKKKGVNIIAGKQLLPKIIELEFIKQNNISTNITNQTNQKEIEQKRLQIENQSDKQGRNATTIRVSDICTRDAKNFRISRKNFGIKNKKKFQRLFYNQHGDIYRRK